MNKRKATLLIKFTLIQKKKLKNIKKKNNYIFQNKKINEKSVTVFILPTSLISGLIKSNWILKKSKIKSDVSENDEVAIQENFLLHNKQWKK